MGSAKHERRYPFRMLGQTGKGLVKKKRMCPGCVCGIRASCCTGRCREAAGKSLAGQGQSVDNTSEKGHRAGRVWPDLPQAEEGGKIGLLKAEWVC